MESRYRVGPMSAGQRFMDLDFVAHPQRPDSALGGEQDQCVTRKLGAFVISIERPVMKAVVPFQPRRFTVPRRHNSPIGDGTRINERTLVRVENAFRVQHSIDLRDAKRYIRRHAVSQPPRGGEGVEAASAALCTGAVSGGQGGGLVEEEKLGVAVGRHDGLLPPFVADVARDPASRRPPLAPDLPILVMQASPIAEHPRLLARMGDQLAERIHPILVRHGKISLGPARHIRLVRPLRIYPALFFQISANTPLPRG